MTRISFFIALMACNVTTALAQEVLPYQDPTRSAAERAADLCDRLTIEEKATIMMDRSRAVKRLGVPEFAWWSEALHGVGRNGVATMFPQCIGMAASFDTTLLFDVYTAISLEARAKNTLQRRTGRVGKYQGLSFWTPTVNIFRDPRWGRGQESYGEDPFLNSVMGCAVVRGLQGPSGSKYRRLLACAKHFAVHSGPEKTRHSFDITDLSARDLWETYLPAFEALVREADVREVMCAYQRFEGAPCCGSNRLLQQILRDKWGFDGIVVSDCGAITDFWREGRHGVSADAPAASADAVRAGTDVECGGNYATLPEAVRRGDISEGEVDASVFRLLKARFELGDFDPDSLVEWTRVSPEVIASPAHRQLSLQMAREQMVLLQNRDALLPLSPSDGKKIVVMGPNAKDSLMLWGIYFGQPAHTVTMWEGIRAQAPDVRYAKGCDLTELTENESLFGCFSTGELNGMTATYWNNENMEGEPVTSVRYEAPIALDNGGNTVFAPGVELEHFSVRIRGRFTAKRSEALLFDYANDDGFRLIVDGDTLHNRWKADYVKLWQKPFVVEAGKTYDVEVNYLQKEGGASMAFDVVRKRPITPADAVRAAGDAEVVIFVGGISPNLEREEAKVTAPGFDDGDRTSIELPMAQRQVLKALHDAGKKIVFVCCSGSAIALKPETETCDAIIEAWYAGEQGGTALADVLFGKFNPCGHLPVTFYASDADLSQDFDDYSMSGGKGRTYRYFKGEALFPFGYGLSFSQFEYSKVKWDAKRGGVSLRVKNVGHRDGQDVVQVYIRDPNDANGPAKTLRGFARVDVKAGKAVDVFVPMPRSAFRLWDEASQSMKAKRQTYQVFVGEDSKRVVELKVNID